MSKVPEMFGSKVFNDKVMRERLPKDIYKALKESVGNDKHLPKDVADVVAGAMKDWAIEKGATHYTHWFQPMTGITAEKHDSFITPAEDGSVIMNFSGKELIKGEPDASSFPSGGIRATFEARGYTAWDPSSYAFIKDNALCIPTAFMAYTGEVLDKKTPLLRSMHVLSRQALRMLKAIGRTDVTQVITTVGPEQEYFLIDKEMYKKREDLIFAGRTLFGARPPKGQELEDHYFGNIKPRVRAFMDELDEELWKLGILAKTRHNEVAPSQHELAPIYTTINVASDHNQLTMEIMKKVAEKHNLYCLLHEKPFAGVNGSGKHNNWSMSTASGENLLEPGKSPRDNLQFLLFLCAVLQGVDEHQDLLRLSAATAGNDHRLGAHEAPPYIVSMFLGDELTSVLESIASDKPYSKKDASNFRTGVDSIPEFLSDTTDRNRTSPFAFTGNKFEFRMLGSSVNIGCPNVMINVAVADALDGFSSRLEKAKDWKKEALSVIKDVYAKHKRIIFNGNNYSEAWSAEAERRGLLSLKTTPEALARYNSEENVRLFEKHKIYTRAEIEARREILLENYSKVINIEALTMTDMVTKQILPAIYAYSSALAEGVCKKKELGITSPDECELIERLSELTVKANTANKRLKAAVAAAKDVKEPLACATNFHDSVFTVMEELRVYCDELETLTAKAYWPYPTYSDLLFY